MKQTILLALLALSPLLASAAGTAMVRVTNTGTVPITVAGQTIRPSATASIAVPAGEAGAFDATAAAGFVVSAPAAYPSLRTGASYSIRLAAERGAPAAAPVPVAPTVPAGTIPVPPRAPVVPAGTVPFPPRASASAPMPVAPPVPAGTVPVSTRASTTPPPVRVVPRPMQGPSHAEDSLPGVSATLLLPGGVPLEMVRLPDGVWAGRYEVTQAQWESVMGPDAKGWVEKRIAEVRNEEHRPGFREFCPIRPDNPVTFVSWDDCQDFLRAINALRLDGSRLRFRLPTEPEWKVAAAAGGKPRGFGLLPNGTEASVDEVCWHAYNSDEIHRVGELKPNAYGLFDMTGNVAEWTSTPCPNRPWRWTCGGDAFNSHPPIDATVSDRGGMPPADRCCWCGFRLFADGTASIRSRQPTNTVTVTTTITTAKTTTGTTVIRPPVQPPRSRIVRDWRRWTHGDAIDIPFANPLPDIAPEAEGMAYVKPQWNRGTDPASEHAYSRFSGQGFFIDKTEVTLSRWRAVKAWGESHGYAFACDGNGEGPDHPVTRVTWLDCIKWCNARSEMEGRTPCYRKEDGSVWRGGENGRDRLAREDDPPPTWIPVFRSDADGYRLPLFSEWEIAARGGVSGDSYPTGMTESFEMANYDYWNNGWFGKIRSADNVTFDVRKLFLWSLEKSHGDHPVYGNDPNSHGMAPVGRFPPNPYGLFDLSGNASEWLGNAEFRTVGHEPGWVARRISDSAEYGHANRFDCILYDDMELDPVDRFPDDASPVGNGVGFRTVRAAPGKAEPRNRFSSAEEVVRRFESEFSRAVENGVAYRSEHDYGLNAVFPPEATGLRPAERLPFLFRTTADQPLYTAEIDEIRRHFAGRSSPEDADFAFGEFEEDRMKQLHDAEIGDLLGTDFSSFVHSAVRSEFLNSGAARMKAALICLRTLRKQSSSADDGEESRSSGGETDWWAGSASSPERLSEEELRAETELWLEEERLFFPKTGLLLLTESGVPLAAYRIRHVLPSVSLEERFLVARDGDGWRIVKYDLFPFDSPGGEEWATHPADYRDQYLFKDALAGIGKAVEVGILGANKFARRSDIRSETSFEDDSFPFPSMSTSGAEPARVAPEEETVVKTSYVTAVSTTSEPAPALTTTVLEGAVETYDSIDDFISVPKNVYDAISPFLGDGAASRAKIMAAVDARWADKFWVPRKFSTILGSVERVMDLWNKLGMAEKAGEIGGLVFLGLRDGKSPSEIADIIADTKTLMPDDFGTSGELGFYLGRIVAGVVSGQSFATIADDLVDFENPDRLGFWGKVGAGLGFLAADAVIGIEKFLNRGERERFERRIIENLRNNGYGEEAEREFRKWLALDDELRVRMPFRLKDEWKIPSESSDGEPASSNVTVAAFVEKLAGIEERHRPRWTDGAGLRDRLPRLRAALADYRKLALNGVPDELREIFPELISAAERFVGVIADDVAGKGDDGESFLDAGEALMTEQLLFIKASDKAGADCSRLHAAWPDVVAVRNMDARTPDVASVVDALSEIEEKHLSKMHSFLSSASDALPLAERFRTLAEIMETHCKEIERLRASLDPSLDESFRRAFSRMVSRDRELTGLFWEQAAAVSAPGGPDYSRLEVILARMDAVQKECESAEADVLRESVRAGVITVKLRECWPEASSPTR